MSRFDMVRCHCCKMSHLSNGRRRCYLTRWHPIIGVPWKGGSASISTGIRPTPIETRSSLEDATSIKRRRVIYSPGRLAMCSTQSQSQPGSPTKNGGGGYARAPRRE